MSGLFKLKARVDQAAADLRAYCASPASEALMAWLDATIVLYREELVDVLPEGLTALQAQVKQLQALKGLASGAVQMSGRI